MTLTEEEILRLKSLEQEKEALESKAREQNVKSGMAGMVNNANGTELNESIQEESRKRDYISNPNCSILLKERISKSPNISLKDIRKYLESIGKINISDDEIQNIIKETDIHKYNELYKVTKIMKSKSVKKHPMIKWSATEHENIVKHLKDTNNDIPETRVRFLRDYPDTKRTSNGITLYIKKEISKTLKTPHKISKTTDIIQSKITTFAQPEKNVLYPEFDKIIKMGKSITDYPEIYTMYTSIIPNPKSVKSVSDHFYHYRKRYLAEQKKEPSHHIDNTLTKSSNNHILGARVIELVRSGNLSQDILTTYKETIREILTIQDVKPEELRTAIQVLETIKP